MTLKDLRKEKGILARKIAEHLGISYRQYHRIENGKAKLDKLKIEKLSQIHEINVTQIEEAWEEGSKKYAKNN